MSQARQNRALIIVNTDFCSSDSDGAFGTRRGAKREAEKLSKTLSRLNYKVKLMHNKTAKEIEDLYQQECCCEHGEYFVSIISSHGNEGVIFGYDSEPVKLTRIFQILSSEKCPVLSKIPKIFFIQACRGKEFDRGVVVECDSREPEPDCLSDYISIPPQTVVMFACSPGKGQPPPMTFLSKTPPSRGCGTANIVLLPLHSTGYVAFLNIFGSMFLQALLKVLEGEERHLALNRLMTRINWHVAFCCQARGTYEGCKEMPCFVTNLLQEVFPFSAPIVEEADGV
ncbi:caspase-7-like [Grus americana]|uniref:caspase-7-like n=1 Tax=Grus americana TaxID=9117 RepID=UPI0024087255|nr:caspase-7-like [Grus americana]